MLTSRQIKVTVAPQGGGGGDCNGWEVSGGPQKVRCGPATVLQPRLPSPSDGLHCLLSCLRGRLPVILPLAQSAAPFPPRLGQRTRPSCFHGGEQACTGTAQPTLPVPFSGARFFRLLLLPPPPPPGVQEPPMFDRGTRGRFLRTLFPQNLTTEPVVGSCARPWATPYRGKKKFPARCGGERFKGYVRL